MGFHQRKLLHQHQYRDSSEAAMASPTPSPSPSPLQSPVPLPTMELPTPWFPLFVIRRHHIINHDHVHVHVLRVAMIVMACVVGLLMFLCTIFIILRNYYSRRHNHNNNSRRRNSPILFDVNGDSPVVSDADEGPIIDHPIWFIRTEGLQQSLIDSITVFKYRKEERLIDGTECSVCLGEFEQDESLRLLPKCSHAFHIPCIDTWLRSHKNCPLCRAPVAHDAAAGGSGSTVEMSATEPDSNVSGQNQENHTENFDGGAGTHHLGETEGSALRIRDDDDDDSGILSSEDGGGESEIPDKILPNFDKVNCNASILIGSQEVEEEIQPIRRSVSMDASSALMIFHDVVHLNSDLESSSSDTHLDDKINSSSKDVIIAKQDSGSSSSTIYKLASIGRALQKRPISLRGSFSHNRRFLFSRHCRSQSSTLPL